MTAETLADRRLHPGTILTRFLKEAPSTLLALPAGIAVISKGDLSRALIVAGVAGIIFLFFNWLAWTRFRYGVGEREIVIESGILHRNRRVIPFDRVQDVDIERALLARLFGLAKVRVETGAGGKDEGLLDSVSVLEADRLRNAVRASKSGEPVSAAAAEEPLSTAAPGHVLFEMPLSKVFFSGLFNFSLVYLAALFAFLQTFDQFLPFDIYDPGRWLGLVEERLPARLTLGAAAAVLFVALVLGVIAGVLRTLARDYGFRLSVEGDRFRRERGLLTRTEAVIAKRRVQLAHLGTGPLRRALGSFALSFQTLGAGTGASGLQTAAPFATTSEIEPILAETPWLRLRPVSELEMVSKRHVLRSIAVHLLPALLVVATAGYFFPPVLLLFAATPLIAGFAVVERRFHRYALVGDLLFVARGVWRQQLWAIPVTSAQAVSVARSPLQRRLGLATLSVDTAGASTMNPPRIVDLRTETAEALGAEIAARRRAHSSGRKSGTER